MLQQYRIKIKKNFLISQLYQTNFRIYKVKVPLKLCINVCVKVLCCENCAEKRERGRGGGVSRGIKFYKKFSNFKFFTSEMNCIRLSDSKNTQQPYLLLILFINYRNIKLKHLTTLIDAARHDVNVDLIRNPGAQVIIDHLHKLTDMTDGQTQ